MKKRTKCQVKICATTSTIDATIAAESGADYSGIVVEVPCSERSDSIEQATEITRQTSIPTILLFFNRSTDWIVEAVNKINPFAIQLLGHEPAEQLKILKDSLQCQIWNSMFLPVNTNQQINLDEMIADLESYITAGADAILFDSAEYNDDKVRFGGTGKTSNWNIAEKLIQACEIPAFLSGGIRPENVRSAIETVRPDGIDLCSGVESERGKRDRSKVIELMQNLQLTSNK